MNNICGHCGTEVAKRFSVCKGCGAHLRRSWMKTGIGIFATLVSVQMLLSTIKAFSASMLLAGLIGIGIGALITKSGFTRKWYRHNS